MGYARAGSSPAFGTIFISVSEVCALSYRACAGHCMKFAAFILPLPHLLWLQSCNIFSNPTFIEYISAFFVCYGQYGLPLTKSNQKNHGNPLSDHYIRWTEKAGIHTDNSMQLTLDQGTADSTCTYKKAVIIPVKTPVCVFT